MIRKIIHIDEEKCTGCGLCAKACHEGAIDIVDGKAKLMREHFCDGFGDCLPNCPAGAITFEEREAPAYDQAAVLQAKREKLDAAAPKAHACPGSLSRSIRREPAAEPAADAEAASPAAVPVRSQLRNWPPQIKLAPLTAPYYDGAKLLIAADCTAFAYAAIQQEFIKGRTVLFGCPKLDGVDYAEKFAEIIDRNNIREVSILRMEVPCCGGLENAAKRALKASGKNLPCQVVTISIDGRILDR